MNQDVMWSKRDRDAGEHYLFGTEPNRFLAHRSRTAAGWKHSLVGPEDRKRQFATMKQFTRPGWPRLLQGYTPKQLDYLTGGPSAMENLYTRDFLKSVFAGLQIEELVEYEEDVSESTGHKGRSASIGPEARYAPASLVNMA